MTWVGVECHLEAWPGLRFKLSQAVSDSSRESSSKQLDEHS